MDKIEEDLKETINILRTQAEEFQRRLSKALVDLALHRAGKVSEEIQRIRKEAFDKEPLRLKLCSLHLRLASASGREHSDALEEIKLIQKSLEIV